MEYKSLSGLDKAAVLLQVLGEPLFVSFFTELPKEQILKIRVRSNELGSSIPTVIKKQILDEYSYLMLQDKYRQSRPESVRLFEFLEDLNDEALFYLLSKEKPSVAALAIDQVSEEKRNNFIENLKLQQKNDVILELGNLGDIPLEMVVEISKELEKKASTIPQSKEFSRGGGKKMADILNTMNEEEANQYLNQVQSTDPDLYSEIKKYYLTFSDLVNMEEEVASDFWTNPDIDIDSLALAVKGIDEEKRNKIIDTLPKKKQAMYQPIEKPMPKKDVMAARRNIVGLAQEMIASDAIKIEDVIGGGEQEMIE
ncbi:MAG: hypothetical protein CMG00_09285 [Candidatus Marinimicrobia bacterium]|nr:hypothetical protein [Candidatus Neomarinimicrobiota bacterium]|tara:strand:+ start:569 stop:1504 length:936 start_codon:yes stop_codon:yes gene_type:complete